MILTGAGQIGMAIARRMGAGMKIVIGDKNPQHAASVAETMNRAGFDALPVGMDLSSRDSILALIDTARSCGEISMLVNAAGVSPSQASVETILRVDLYGTAVLLEEVGRVISRGGVGDRSPSRYLATACCSIPNRGSGRCLTATFDRLPSNRLYELSDQMIRGLFCAYPCCQSTCATTGKKAQSRPMVKQSGGGCRYPHNDAKTTDHDNAIYPFLGSPLKSRPPSIGCPPSPVGRR